MNEAAYYNQFYIGLAIAGTIVVVAALLLILIWMAARRILKLASAALTLVIKIKENTMSIWGLLETNHKAVNILSEAETIENSAGLVAEAFHETEQTK
ncbi:MAG: hypothetical protein NVS3B8_02130 [Chitinophagaceae bacterium]